MDKRLVKLKIWRVDVPPVVFRSLVGDRKAENMSALRVNILHVLANSRNAAFKKAWNVVKDCGVPVSEEELKVGEYPSVIDCLIK